MATVDIPQDAVSKLLDVVLKIEPNAEVAFCMLVIAAAAIARDVGGLDKAAFLANAASAWGAAPKDLVAPGSDPAKVKKGELN